MNNQEKSKQPLSSFDEIFARDLSSLTKERIIDLLEFGYGEYLSQVFLKEWEFSIQTDTIDKLELEHGKSLALLIKDEIRNIDLEELNKKLMEATAIYEKDIKMAETIQKSLLFKKAPLTENFDIAFYYQPLSSVSGDFYDFYIDNSHHLKGAVLADVSGHGIASGLLTALAKPIFFRLFGKHKTSPLNKIADLINKELISQIGDSYNYLTAVILRFDGDLVEYINAAHPDIIMRKAETGECSPVNSPGKPINGSILGVSSILIPFVSYKFSIKKNDVLVIYSDGVIESQNDREDLFGKMNIIKSLKYCPEQFSASQILDQLMRNFTIFINNNPVVDDLTILVLKKK